MRIGLTFEEYVEMRGKSHTGIGRLTEGLPSDPLLPMHIDAASRHLHARGYDCKPQMLDLLVENGVVKPSQPDAWTQSELAAAAEFLEYGEIYTPHAAMCQTLGCRFVDYLRSLREAAECETARYGREVPASDQYFVLHCMPSRMAPGERGERGEVDPSKIWFSLCDDIREQLERGEDI